MKKLFFFVLVLFLALSLAPSFEVPAYADDEQFEYVTACEWANIGDYSEGLAAIQGFDASGARGFYGYMDRFGKIQIPPEWEEANAFSEGFAAVKRNGRWGYIDQEGVVVIEPQFADAGTFSEGVAWVRVFGENNAFGRYGYIDKSGELTIDAVYNHARDFSEGLAAVNYDSRYVYITNSGEVAIDNAFSHASSFYGDYAVVNLAAENRVVIDKTGEVVVRMMGKRLQYIPETQTLWVLRFGDEGTIAQPFTTNAIPDFELSGDYSSIGYSEENGILIIYEEKKEMLHFFDNDFNPLAVVEHITSVSLRGDIAGKAMPVQMYNDYGVYLGFIDYSGNLAITPRFRRARVFFEGRAVVSNDNNRFGIIRLSNDGELFSQSRDQVAAAYPMTIYINGSAQSAYNINNHAYVDVSVLPRHGLNVTTNEGNRSISISRNFLRKKTDVPDSFNLQDSYEVYELDWTVFVGDIVTSAYLVDGRIVVKVDELRIYGRVVWDDNAKLLSVFINFPYLQNEGILWQTITDPNGISDAVFQGGYYMLKTPANMVRVYDSNLEFLFEGYSRWSPLFHQGIFRFSSEQGKYYYMNELGETIPEPDEKLPNNSHYLHLPITPDPYPKLSIVGRLLWSGVQNEYRPYATYSAGKCGYLDENGDVVIDYRWTDARDFVKGTALVNETAIAEAFRVVTGGLWGLIDTNGDYIVEPKWKFVARYADGKIRINDRTFYGLIDERGNELIPMEYNMVEYRSGSDYVPVRVGSGSVNDGAGDWRLVDLRNQNVIAPYFRNIVEQENGIFCVKSWNGASIVRVIDMPVFGSSVYINNEEVEFDTPPLLINDRTMIPIRAVFEKMGCLVQWFEDSSTAVVTRGDMRIEIMQDANFIIRNGEYIYSDLNP